MVYLHLQIYLDFQPHVFIVELLLSEALLTTQTGLVVAVPGLFLATFLARRANGQIERMQRFCLRVTRSGTSNIDI